jgi:exopolysaccharide biosynthesis polyprenyl glycosylphosphotransferase
LSVVTSAMNRYVIGHELCVRLTNIEYTRAPWLCGAWYDATMLREHSSFFRRVMMIIDMLLIVGAFFLAYALCAPWTTLLSIDAYVWMLPIIACVWVILLYLLNVYRSSRLKRALHLIGAVTVSGLVSFLVFTSLTYMLKTDHYSRLFVISVFGLAWFFISVKKVIFVYLFRFLRRKGLNFRHIIVAGTGRRAQKFIQQCQTNRDLGLKVVGVIDQDQNLTGQLFERVPVLGTFGDMPDILKGYPVDQVIFIIPRSWLDDVEPVLDICQTFGIKASLSVDFFNVSFIKRETGSLFGFPLVHFEQTVDHLQWTVFKRVFDVICSFLGLLVLLPFFALMAIVIKCTSPGPVFFRQTRCGLNGRRFVLYKFRTMVIDAEERLKELMAQNEMSGPAFKMDNDPRLTPVGRFLRRYSLDEFPQLWNVLKGDMSLVGPRPPLDREVVQYENWHRRRLSMRPGLTCLWQVSGRNQITKFDDWMRLDLKYIENWSFGLDLKILLKTIPVVLSGDGAK